MPGRTASTCTPATWRTAASRSSATRSSPSTSRAGSTGPRRTASGWISIPTYFSHPKAADGFTLTHPDERIRQFWIEHGIACRKIGAAIGRQLGTPCVTNVWIPDGYKDVPVDRNGAARAPDRVARPIFAEPIDPEASPRRRRSQAVRHRLGELRRRLARVLPGLRRGAPEAAHARRRPLPSHRDHRRQDLVGADVLPGTAAARQPRRPLGQRPRGDPRRRAAGDRRGNRPRRQAPDRIHIGLDYFDASINRVAAWVIGTRDMLKALLMALLEPTATLQGRGSSGWITRGAWSLLRRVEEPALAGRMGLLLRAQRRARGHGLVRRGAAVRKRRALETHRPRRGPVSFMQTYENFINGRFTPSTGEDRIVCTNPSTGETICTVPDSTAADVETAISAAQAAQKSWSKRPPSNAPRRSAPSPPKSASTWSRSPASSPRSRARSSTWRASRSHSPPTTSTTWPNGRAASKAKSSRATAPARPSFCSASPSA